MRRILLLLISVYPLLAFAGAGATSDYSLYLIRHAEKQLDGSADPELTRAGLNRSQRLLQRFKNSSIEAIWSSDTTRTRDTVQPLAAALGLPTAIYDAGNQAQLVTSLNSEKRNAVIVGHSNTIPELARLLCQCKISDMDETEHDRLIIVSVKNGQQTIKTILQ